MSDLREEDSYQLFYLPPVPAGRPTHRHSGANRLWVKFVFYAFDKRESRLELERKDFNERLMHQLSKYRFKHLI